MGLFYTCCYLQKTICKYHLITESLSFLKTPVHSSSFHKCYRSSDGRTTNVSRLLNSLCLETKNFSSSVNERCGTVCSNNLNKRNLFSFQNGTEPTSTSFVISPRSSHSFGDISDIEDSVVDNLKKWLASVDEANLTPMEKKIHKRHLDAILNGKVFYIDPQSGYNVITRLVHLQRGDCCGNSCRHCPFCHSNVPTHRKKKTYNSSFYV